MGDTGAMALGGAMAAMAILLKVELLLLLVGGIFVIEALSVMLQVITFKYWGRRVFLMAPIAPPLRDEGVVGDEDHGALLDRRPRSSAPPGSRSSTSTTRRSGRIVEGARLRLARSGPRRRSSGSTIRCVVDRSLGNEDDLSLLDGVEVVVKSPGVPGEAPLVAAARAAGDPGVVGGRARLPAPAGRDGSSASPARTARRRPPSCSARSSARPDATSRSRGTSARPLTSVREADWVVCELSSFQLEDVHQFACDVAVLLNLEPDHLDRYGSFEAYRDAKLRIFERARAKVVPRGLGLEGIEFAADDPLPAEPLIRGAHNRENAAAATAAARAAGIADDADRRGAAHLPRRAAPARARRRARRRALRERLEGDERRGGTARARRVRATSPCT